MTLTRLSRRHFQSSIQSSCESLVSSISLVSISENAPLDNFTNRPFKRPSTLNGWGTEESRKSYKRGLHELIDDDVKKSSRRCDEVTKQARCISNVSPTKDTWGFYVEHWPDKAMWMGYILAAFAKHIVNVWQIYWIYKMTLTNIKLSRECGKDCEYKLHMNIYKSNREKGAYIRLQTVNNNFIYECTRLPSQYEIEENDGIYVKQ